MTARVALPLLLAAAWLPAQEERYVQIEMRDGTKVVGRIVEAECTDDLLVVRQLRGDAKVRIRWDDVQDEAARRLRVDLGLEVEEAASGALVTRGHEIRNKAGVVFRGLWVNEGNAGSQGVFVLKTSEGERRIPAGDVVSGPDPIEISLLEIYTPRELYARKRAETEPESAEDHFKLAEYALVVDALEEAKLHYERVLALDDPKYTRDKIERRLVQLQRLLGQAEARAALKEIQRAIFANRYDKAGTLLAAFKEKYGADEELAKAAAELEERSRVERDAYFVGRVPARIRDAVKDLLERKLKEEKELTLRAAQEYAGGEPTSERSVSRQATELVGTQLGIASDEVLRFWEARLRRNVYKGFYRDGTFVVLDNVEDALAKAPKPAKPAGGKDAPKVPAPAKQKTPDEWWKGKVEQRRFGDLRDWLYAWWAEKSGMCELLEPKDEICTTCNGKGYTQTMYTTPQGTVPFFNRCQTCHMATFQRVVRFR